MQIRHPSLDPRLVRTFRRRLAFFGAIDFDGCVWYVILCTPHDEDNNSSLLLFPDIYVYIIGTGCKWCRVYHTEDANEVDGARQISRHSLNLTITDYQVST